MWNFFKKSLDQGYGLFADSFSNLYLARLSGNILLESRGTIGGK